ncbi:MAG: peptide chain release factor N(5)-glutamine methyltransferase [Candidatus Babeliales bacterium]|jgi:release factor glutamine methyltransferase
MAVLTNEFIKQLCAKLCACCTTEHEARQEAMILLAHVMQINQAQLLARTSITLTKPHQQQLDQELHARIDEHKPLAYILGSVPFCNLDILVEPPILIPRPETEEWVSWLIEQCTPVRNQACTILDLCTGTGCIALALAQALPHARVTGVDKNPTAIALAQKNKDHNALSNVEFVQGDLCAPLPQDICYDLIVSNPPYIAEKEYQSLAPEITHWEDKQALVAPNDGLEFYQRLAYEAARFLCPESIFSGCNLPRMVVELGTEPEKVADIYRKAGFSRVKIHYDLQDKERWLAARI